MHIGIISPFSCSDYQALGGRRLEDCSEWGRSTPVVRSLIKDLLTDGHRVTVFGIEKISSSTVELGADQLSLRIVRHRRKTAVAMADGYKREREALVELIESDPPDILHAHWTQYGHALTALDAGIPTVVTVHDAAKDCARLNRGYRPIDWFCNRRAVDMTRHVLKRTQHVIAVSPYVEQHLRTEFKYSGEIRLIPNLISPPREKAAMRKGVLEDPVFISIGHWGALKNMKTVIHAFTIVKERQPKAKLILVGPGLGPNEAAERWAKRQKWNHGVEFMGTLSHEQTIKLLKDRADIMVQLSRSEGFGMALCEALSNAVAVIAGQSGSMPWLLENGNAGLLVPVEGPAEISASMIELAVNPARRIHLTNYGQAMMGCRFDRHGMLRQHIKYYRDIVSRGLKE